MSEKKKNYRSAVKCVRKEVVELAHKKATIVDATFIIADKGSDLYGAEITARGVSKCSDEDEYDPKTGFRIAYQKAKRSALGIMESDLRRVIDETEKESGLAKTKEIVELLAEEKKAIRAKLAPIDEA